MSAMAWTDQRGSHVLPRNECVRLLWLHAGGVGRVGVAANGQPFIMPVNYRMLGQDVVVRIGRGSMLGAVEHRSVLAFEVDSTVPPDAWSVYVRGPARIADRPSVHADARPQGAGPWVPHPGTVDVVIRSDVVSGRRFPLIAPDGPAVAGRPLGAISLRPPVRAPSSATIRDVAATMEAMQVSSVVLCEHPMEIGSEHDLIGGLAAGLDPGSPARDVATRTPLWVTTASTLDDAAAVMAKHCVQHLLVITAEGELVGVLSRREALRQLVEDWDQSPSATVTSGGAGQKA
jgi:CBS domain-containing protein